MKPKITAYTNLYPLPWEPSRATFNRQQFTFLSELFDVSVNVPVAWTHLLRTKQSFKTERLSQDSFVSVRYFSYFFIPRFMRWSYGLTQFLSALRLIPGLIGKQRPDLVLATWVYPDAFAAVLLAKLCKIPVMVKVHGSDINENTLLLGVKAQISWTLKQADGVIAVSQDLADKVIALGAKPNTTKVIYNGVDLLKFSPQDMLSCRKKLKLSADSAIVLYVGNLKTAKGCVDLLHGFARLLKKQANVNLVYIGDGVCAEPIKALAEQLSISDRVKLFGTIPHDSLPLWMAASDLVALPSHNEGVPNVLLEAMACGKPVVATAVGGIPEIVPEFAGFLLDKGDIQALADYLFQALEQDWNQDQISTYAKKFNWQKNSTQVYDSYLQILRKKDA